jgi:hypothetical protein
MIRRATAHTPIGQKHKKKSAPPLRKPGDPSVMRTTITLAANETATITEKEASLSGIYNEITLGQYTRLIVDGAEVTFKHITLERLGTRVIELVNGAQLHVGALGFASMGASIVYRIGAGCALTFDASQWDPEVVANTTFDFASQGSGSLKYFPFINPEWLDCPNVTGYSEGDLLEIAGQGSAQRFQVRDGRIVANRPR